MVYAYRLKNRKSEKTGCVVEGFTVRGTWQFTSDSKAVALKKWAKKVAVIEAQDIGAAKKEVEAYDKGESSGTKEERGKEEKGDDDGVSLDTNDPLVKELEGKSLAELKDFAKANGFDEAEYSKFTKSKLLEYIVLGMGSNKIENA